VRTGVGGGGVGSAGGSARSSVSHTFMTGSDVENLADWLAYSASLRSTRLCFSPGRTNKSSEVGVEVVVGCGGMRWLCE
jgi:hypothetical protein